MQNAPGDARHMRLRCFQTLPRVEAHMAQTCAAKACTGVHRTHREGAAAPTQVSGKEG